MLHLNPYTYLGIYDELQSALHMQCVLADIYKECT